jgi:hypothetical protein
MSSPKQSAWKDFSNEDELMTLNNSPTHASTPGKRIQHGNMDQSKSGLHFSVRLLNRFR